MHTRPAPAQEKVAAFVERHPGTVAIHAARAAGPHGSLRFGYRAVHRAVAAGRVRAERAPNGRIALFPVSRG